MNNSLKKNYIYNLIYQIVAIFVPILITPYISKTIGASGIGYYSYSMSLCTYFILFAELSVEIYGQREIAFCKNDTHKRSIVFCELIAIRIITTLISTVCYCVFVGFQEGILKTLLLIQFIDLISVSIEINWLLRGVEDFKAILLRNLTVKFLYIVGILLFVKSSEDLLLYVFICTASLTLANMSSWLSVKKYITKVKFSELNIKRHLFPLIQVFIPTIAMSLYHLIDKTMLGAILHDSVESGNYEQGLKLITVATTVITSFGTVMAPRVSSLYAEKNTESIRENIKNAFDIVWLFALPIGCGLFFIAPLIVPWFFGDEFEIVEIILRILSLIIIPIGMKNVLGAQYLVATNKQNKYTLAIVSGLVVNTLLNAVLIPLLYSEGAAVASIVSEVFIVVFLFVIVRKEITIVDAFSGFLKKAFSTLIMGLLIYFISGFCKPRILDTVIIVVVAAIVYFSALLLLKDNTLLSLVRRKK